MIADRDVVEDYRAHSDVTPGTDSAVAGDVGTGHDADEIADVRVMSDERTAVQQHVPAYNGVRSDYHSDTDDRTVAEQTSRRNASGGMNQREKAESEAFDLMSEPASLCRTEGADGKVGFRHGGNVINPVDGQPFKRFVTPGPVHVLDESFDAAVGNVRRQIEYFGRERARSQD